MNLKHLLEYVDIELVVVNHEYRRALTRKARVCWHVLAFVAFMQAMTVKLHLGRQIT